MIPTNEQCQWVRVTGNKLVKSGQGLLSGFLCASGTPTIKIYDGLDNSGQVLLNSMVCAAATPYPLPALVNKGIYVESSGGDCTFFYN